MLLVMHTLHVLAVVTSLLFAECGWRLAGRLLLRAISSGQAHCAAVVVRAWFGFG